VLQDFYRFATAEDVKDTFLFDFSNFLSDFSKTYADTLNKIYASPEDTKKHEQLQKMLDTYISTELAAYHKRQQEFDTEKFIKKQIKTLVARNLYDANKSTKIWLEDDQTYLKTYEIINNTSLFEKMKINY
jgi:predicted ArsR family transcriptional regulator